MQETSFQGRQLYFILCITNNFWGTSIHLTFRRVCAVLFFQHLLDAAQMKLSSSMVKSQSTLEENAPGHFCTEHLLGRQETENPRFLHVWKRKRRRLERLQILSEHARAFKTTSEVALSLPTHPFSPAADWSTASPGRNPYGGPNACDEVKSYLPQAEKTACPGQHRGI